MPISPEETKIVNGEQKEEAPSVPFLQLYRYATRLDRFILLFGSLFSVVSGICNPLFILLYSNFASIIVRFGQIMADPAQEQEWEAAKNRFMNEIIKNFTYSSILGIVMLILNYLTTVLFNYTATRQMYRIRILYFKSILNQDIPWYDQHQTGDFASRLSEDMIKLEDGLGEKVSLFVYYQVSFLCCMIIAFIQGWQFALVCLTVLFLPISCLVVVALITSKLAKQEMETYGAAGAIAEEVLSAIKTVVAFGGEEKELARYLKKLTAAKSNNIKRALMLGIGTGMMICSMYFCYAFSFWYGIKLILDSKRGVYDIGSMLAVFLNVSQGGAFLGLCSPYMEVFGISKGAAAKIYSIIDNVPIINSSKNNGKILSEPKGNIIFRNVHFVYPSRPDVKILQGLNLTIESGETVALVGSSGCGKSTCIQLLQRFYDPLSGELYLDGNRLNELDLTWLRSNIGVVGQEPVLFGTTIAENIRYGHISVTQDDIERAAKKANAHIFISSLPQGYDTLVGERGAQLSGGQKQRIAIARALVREPSILLLDEATSALDTNSEAKVQAALDNAGKGCTTIIVAHRLSTIRNANKIFVLSEGKVVEEGNHQQLMNKKGTYYDLVMTQVSASGFLKSDDRNTSEELEDCASPVEEDLGSEEIAETNKHGSSPLIEIIKLNSPECCHILAGCIGSLIIGTNGAAFAIIFGDIIGQFVNLNGYSLKQRTNQLVLLFVIVGVIMGFFTFLQIYMFGVAGEKLTMRLRYLMFEAMLRQEIGWFDRKENAVGSLCVKLSEEATSVQGATGLKIGTVLQGISILIFSVGISIYYDWKLSLVIMSLAPFMFLATFYESRLVGTERQEQHTSLEKSTRIAVEAVSNIRTVASLGCEDTFHQAYMMELRQRQKFLKRNRHARAIVMGLSRSIFVFVYAVCFLYGGILIKDEGMPIANVFKIFESLMVGTITIANAMAFTPNLQKGFIAASNIFKFLNRTPEIANKLHANSARWKRGNIEYSKVSFSYPTRPTIRVLKDLDLSIMNGKTVALVGPSGCGKSTILQLLERYYDPMQGQVAIDGDDIREMKLSTLRSQLGVVSQEPNLFDKTIAENIAYGDNERDVEMEEIIEAAKNANIHNFISTLPLGYDTRLGERGTQLSGGQKQRVAIARALVRNPRVLLLDEATSALDTESEKVVQAALDNAKQGRTCITIAHRLTTTKDADVICVINQGKVSEVGTHAELISQKGVYYTLYGLQNG